MPADLAVVSDLAKVVDLARLADHGVADAAAVDRRAGADLDIVLDDDAAGLRNLLLRGVLGVAEAVLADAAAGMNHDAIADQRMRDRGAGADPAIAADRDVGTDHGIGGNQTARADFGARSDDGAGIDDDVAFKPGRGMDGRTFEDTIGLKQRRRPQRLRVELAVHRDKSPVRLLRMQNDKSLPRALGQAQRHQAGAGAGRRQRIGEFVAVDESEIGRAGKIDRRHAGNQLRQRCCLTRLRTRQRHDFGDRQALRAIKKAAVCHCRGPMLNVIANTGPMMKLVSSKCRINKP